MKKQKIGAFTVGILMGLLMTSCGGKNKENEQTDQNNENARIEALRAEQELKEKYWDFERHVKDSVLVARGFDAGDGYYRKKRELEDSIRVLRNRNTPRFALETAVFNAGKSIADNYINILQNKLNVYGLSLNKNAIKERFYDVEIIMFGAYKDANREEDAQASCVEDVIDNIIRNIGNYVDIDNTSYGEGRKQEIINMIKNTLIEMCDKLYASRKATEAKFAQYFPGGTKTINIGCVDDLGEGMVAAGYSDYYLNMPVLITYKTIHLYDSKLPADFFMDENAKYSVEKVGNGKWYIVKKTKDGKVSKTQTFTHDTDYQVNTRFADSVESEYYEGFRATAGDNVGMHINASEIVKVERAKTVFPRSQKIDNQISELEAEKQQLEKRENDYDSACKYADSLANEMWVIQSRQTR